jgi:F-type H+-transporting ATPase subunit delta
MAEDITLARPYAEAVFALARDAKKLDAWQETLARMAQVAADPLMHQCIGDPKLLPEKLAQLFLDVVGGKADAARKNFVQLLIENDRLVVLPSVYALFVELKNEHEGVKQARITSAFPLDDKALKQLVAELEPRFGCKLEPSVVVDPELIGGVTVAVGDEVIDASVRGKLATMATVLTH